MERRKKNKEDEGTNSKRIGRLWPNEDSNHK